MALDSSKPTVQQTYGDAVDSIRDNFQDYDTHKEDGSAHGLDSTNGKVANLESEIGNARGAFPTLSAREDGQDVEITALSNRLISTETWLEQNSTFDADNPILINPNTITANTTIATGNNAMSIGPMATASGVTLTIHGNYTTI